MPGICGDYFYWLNILCILKFFPLLLLDSLFSFPLKRNLRSDMHSLHNFLNIQRDVSYQRTWCYIKYIPVGNLQREVAGMYRRGVEGCPVWVLMEYLLLPCHSHSSNLKIHTHGYMDIPLNASRHIFRNTQYQTKGSFNSTATPCSIALPTSDPPTFMFSWISKTKEESNHLIPTSFLKQEIIHSHSFKELRKRHSKSQIMFRVFEIPDQIIL